MPVSVLMPNQPAPERSQAKESDLDKLLKGLQVANMGFGIYTDYKRIEDMKAGQEIAQSQEVRNKEKDERMKKGIYTPDEMAALEKNYGGLVPPETPGAIKVKLQKDENNYEDRYISPSEALKAQKFADGAKAAKENSEKKYSEASKLRDEYIKQSKVTGDVILAYDKVKAAAKGGKGTDDITLLYNYVKMLDPQSAVKEGEITLSEGANSAANRALLFYNNVKSGEKLSPQQRLDFLDSAEKQLRSTLEYQKITDDYYRSLAKYGQIDEQYVVNPRYQNVLDQVSTAPGGGQAQVPYAPPTQPFNLQDIDAELQRRTKAK